MNEVITKARDLVANQKYEISEHVVRSLTGEKVKIQEIENAILFGDIIEIHRNPKRDNSYLMVNLKVEEPLHVIFAEPKDDLLVILMCYRPCPPLWKDPKTRTAKGEIGMNYTMGNCFFCGEKIKSVTVGNFDYRLEGRLYVIKNVPAGLCLGCGEKYVSASTAKKIAELVEKGTATDKEEVLVFQFA